MNEYLVKYPSVTRVTDSEEALIAAAEGYQVFEMVPVEYDELEELIRSVKEEKS